MTVSKCRSNKTDYERMKIMTIAGKLKLNVASHTTEC